MALYELVPKRYEFSQSVTGTWRKANFTFSIACVFPQAECRLRILTEQALIIFIDLRVIRVQSVFWNSVPREIKWILRSFTAKRVRWSHSSNGGIRQPSSQGKPSETNFDFTDHLL